MKVIDAHAHIFPQKIAERAVSSIGSFYGIPMDDDGTADVLLREMRATNVSQSLVCSVATKPEQVTSINTFLAEEAKRHPEFVPFAAMHPMMADPEAEFERILKAGFYGIKLHPDFQAFYIDDPCADVIYRLAEGKLPILFHTGDHRYEWSRPYRLARVMERFPSLVCVGAHFGGWSCWQESYDTYRGGRLYMDTSSSLMFLKPEEARRFLDKFGAERFFFGTDFPMWRHADELARFHSLGLDEETEKKILSENFERVILRKEN